jgi:TRAP-type uncharacterized transport system substrate-binding protein
MIKVLFETRQDFIDYLKKNPFFLLETRIENGTYNEMPLSYPVILVYNNVGDDYLGMFIYLSDFNDEKIRP